MKTFTGKIGKIHKGIGHYAEVEIRIPSNIGNYIIINCSGKGYTMQGYVEDAPENGYEDWKNMAIEGVKIGISMMNKSENLGDVEIIRISGLSTDTTLNAVKCAAIYSIFSANNHVANIEQELEINKLLEIRKY